MILSSHKDIADSWKKLPKIEMFKNFPSKWYALVPWLVSGLLASRGPHQKSL